MNGEAIDEEGVSSFVGHGAEALNQDQNSDALIFFESTGNGHYHEVPLDGAVGWGYTFERTVLFFSEIHVRTTWVLHLLLLKCDAVTLECEHQ